MNRNKSKLNHSHTPFYDTCSIHLIITDSLLCPLGKKALTLSIKFNIILFWYRHLINTVTFYCLPNFNLQTNWSMPFCMELNSQKDFCLKFFQRQIKNKFHPLIKLNSVPFRPFTSMLLWYVTPCEYCLWTWRMICISITIWWNGLLPTMNFSCVKSTLTQENPIFTWEVLCLKVTASYA